MRKRYTKRGSVGKASRKQRRKRQAGENRTVQLVLDREELVAMMQDSLTDFATEMGLKVASLLLEDEVHQRCHQRATIKKMIRLQLAPLPRHIFYCN